MVNMPGSKSSTDLASLIDQTTIVSLLSTLAILGVAYLASLRLLPASSSTKLRVLFVWHAFDSLIHLTLEGGFLYNCFFSYTTVTSLWHGRNAVSAYLPPNIFFMGFKDRLYGAQYGTNPLSALWREYAKADARWGGSDLTVISLELLTVFIGGPMASWICYCLWKQRDDAWFWMIVLATGELYGGFMTFCPEWLTGSPNLDTSNVMYMWLYLTFFNMLWVFIPFWILYEGYKNIAGASETQNAAKSLKKRK